jgi:hypothetical protein
MERAKETDEVPLRVVGTKAQQRQIIFEFHESNWAGRRGTWATFNKIKQKYWWKGMYKDVAQYTECCKKC